MSLALIPLAIYVVWLWLNRKRHDEAERNSTARWWEHDPPPGW